MVVAVGQQNVVDTLPLISLKLISLIIIANKIILLLLLLLALHLLYDRIVVGLHAGRGYVPGYGQLLLLLLLWLRVVATTLGPVSKLVGGEVLLYRERLVANVALVGQRIVLLLLYSNSG